MAHACMYVSLVPRTRVTQASWGKRDEYVYRFACGLNSLSLDLWFLSMLPKYSSFIWGAKCAKITFLMLSLLFLSLLLYTVSLSSYLLKSDVRFTISDVQFRHLIY